MVCRIVLVISLLFSSNLLAQRVTSIDSKGTKNEIGVVVTEAATAPTNPTPIQGDIWFDTSTNTTRVYDGTSWEEIDPDNVTESATAPSIPKEGDIWFDTTDNLVKVWDSSTWKTIASTDPDDLRDDQKIDTLALQGDTLLQISLEGDDEAVKSIDLSALNSNDWQLDGNSGTTAGTDFVGTTDAQDLVFKTNNRERLRIKEGDSARVLLANPGDFAFPGVSSSAVIGIDGTNHSRLRITAGDDESFNDSKGASIDLHGNTSTANTGVLDLVAGSAADSSKSAIKFWTNTDGSTQQTSAVITGEGKVGIGTIDPKGILDMASINDKAVRHPQVSLTSRKDTVSVKPLVDGMLVYNTNETGTGTTTTQISANLQGGYSTIVSTNNRTNFKLDTLVLAEGVFSSSLANRTFSPLTTTNNTDTKGVVPSSTNVIGNIKSYYWLYLVESNVIKAIKVEFRISGSDLQVRYTMGREKNGSAVASANRTDDYFSTDGLDFSEDAISIYSLRRVNPNYSGNAITVRRSSDSTEVDIKFTTSGDLDETALTNFVGSGDGFITTWYDQQGWYDLVQPALSRQPKIVSSGTINKLGGKPIIEFKNASLYRNTGSPDAFDEDLAVFMVMRIKDEGDEGRFFQYGGADYYFLLREYGNTDKMHLFVHGTDGVLETSGAYTYGSHDQMSVLFDKNGTNTMYLNGSSLLTSTLSSGTWKGITPQRLTLGANRNTNSGFSEVGYQEVILYGADKSTDRQDIESNQDDYWKNGVSTSTEDWSSNAGTVDHLDMQYDGNESRMYKGHFVWNAAKSEWNPQEEIRKNQDPSGNNLAGDFGELMWDQNDNELQVWNGNIWEPISGASQASQNSTFKAPWYSSQTNQISDNVNESIYHLGNVGISTESPSYGLDVQNSFRNTGKAKITVMGGSDDMSGKDRGIHMWTENNPDWGIYMSRSGTERSMSSGTAVGGGNFSNYAMRFRVNDDNNNGFIFENHNEELLASIRASDGLIRNSYIAEKTDQPSQYAQQVMINDRDGDIFTNSYQMVIPKTILNFNHLSTSGNGTAVMKIPKGQSFYFSTTVGSKCYGWGYQHATGVFTREKGFRRDFARGISGGSTPVTYGGSGTTADPWTMSLRAKCTHNVVFTVIDDVLYVRLSSNTITLEYLKIDVGEGNDYASDVDGTMLLTNKGDFTGTAAGTVIGIRGTNHARLRLTAGDSDPRNDSKAASIDLHGNTSTANTGKLDLVAGSAASGANTAIRMWTNTGSAQQQSMVITGAGDVGIGVTDPTQRLDVNGAGQFRNGQGASTYTGNQIRFSHNGSTNYANAIRTRHHGSNDVYNTIDMYTWDAGTDAIGDDPTLHGITVAGGRLGVSQKVPSTFLHVSNTNGIDRTAVNVVDPIFRLQREGAGGANSKYTQNVEFRLGTYEDIVSARTRLDITMGLGNTHHVDRTPMTIRADGRVGINQRTTPEYNLDVNGTFKNNNAGLFTVMGGNDDDVDDATAGGYPKRGIRMWRWNDNRWGIYMSRSGAGRSLSSGTAVAGLPGLSAHSIRFRVQDLGNVGFIFENSNEELLASIRGSDGASYFAGNMGIGVTAPTEKLEVNGTIKATDINFTGLPTHADEAAATAAGLTTGDMYKTATGELRIKL